MKNIFTVLLLIIFTNVYAQEVVNEGVISNTERIIDKYGGKLADSFTQAMETAAPVAKESFAMVVKLQIAKGVGLMLIPVICIVFWLIFFKNYRKASLTSRDTKKYWVDGERGTVAVVSLVFAIALTIASVFCLYEGTLRLIAPEWFAIKEIAELF